MIVIKNNTGLLWCVVSIAMIFCAMAVYPQESNKDAKNIIVRNIELMQIKENNVPVVQIRFVNHGEKKTHVQIPYKNKYKIYYIFDLYIENKRANSIVPNLRGRLWKIGSKILKPDETHHVEVDSGKMYKIPETWKTMEFYTERHLGKSALRIKKIDEKRCVAVERNVDMYKGADIHQNPRVDVSMDLQNEFPGENNNIKVNVSFNAPGSYEIDRKSVRLPLNKQNVLKNLVVSIDGKKLKQNEKKNPNQKDSKKTKLDPGQTFKETLDLNKSFEIPEKWNKINIKLKRFHPALYKTDTLTIKRFKNGTKEKKKDNKDK